MTDLVDNLHRYLRALETGDPDRQLCDPEDDVVIVRSAIDEIERLTREYDATIMHLEAALQAKSAEVKALTAKLSRAEQSFHAVIDSSRSGKESPSKIAHMALVDIYTDSGKQEQNDG